MLTTGEITRIKSELGFNVLSLGAEPYVSITQYFEQIAIPNLQAGAVTTSATAVTASDPAAPVTLTVVSTLGISMFDRVIIDVDDSIEMATVRAVSGTSVTVLLRLAHSGTYPVMVEGGESLVRYYLARCRSVADKIDAFGDTAGLKSVDKQDVVWFGGANEKSGLESLGDLLRYWRIQLCTLLFGVGNIDDFRSGSNGGGSRLALY